MFIPPSTVNAICDILGVNPGTTTRIDIDGQDKTVTIDQFDSNKWDFITTTHQIRERLGRPWYMNDDGGMVIDLMDAPPIFRATWAAHNGWTREKCQDCGRPIGCNEHCGDLNCEHCLCHHEGRDG